MVWLPEEFNFVTAKTTNETITKPTNYQFTGHNKPWYGNTIPEQFSMHTRESILRSVSTTYLTAIILRKLLKAFKDEVEDLKTKNIDIYKYAGKIQPLPNE